MLKAINHKWYQVQNSATLAIHSRTARRMQECLKKTTNFGQSQRLIGDQLAQGGGVRSDPQKWGQHLHLIEDFHAQLGLYLW